MTFAGNVMPCVSALALVLTSCAGGGGSSDPGDADASTPDVSEVSDAGASDGDGPGVDSAVDGSPGEVTDAAHVDAASDGEGSACDYIGDWPCNPDKEAMSDPGWQGECPGSTGCACGPEDEPWLGWVDSDACDSGQCYGQPKGGFCAPGPGTPAPRFKGVDQFGQEVDLYDFAGHGKIIALDMSTGWCTPCKELAQWFIDGDPLVKENPWWNESWVPVRDMVNSGQILWITVLYEDENGEDATPELVDWWYQSWPHEIIPVLEDHERRFHTWLRPTGLPCVNLLAEDMTTLTYTDRGIDAAFDKLMELYVSGGL